MPERLSPVIPQVPVEDLAIHVAKSRVGLGNPAFAAMLQDGVVGVYADVWRPRFGLFPRWKRQYIGKLGPTACQILAPALAEGINLRLRIVLLTPEHLATQGQPEIMVSVWADPQAIAPYITMSDLIYPKASSAMLIG